MKRLSSGKIGFYRFGMPLSYLVSGVVAKIALSFPTGSVAIIVVGMSVYSIWLASRLSEVWLDGDVLEVKGPASFRVPLADVLLLDTGPGGKASHVFVLGLDPPVGKIEKVRFDPANDAVEKELQARIHAARAARGRALK
jgi:hypothetical protein